MRSMDCQHLSYSTDSEHHLSCEKTRSNLHCEKGEKGQVSVYSPLQVTAHYQEQNTSFTLHFHSLKISNKRVKISTYHHQFGLFLWCSVTEDIILQQSCWKTDILWLICDNYLRPDNKISLFSLIAPTDFSVVRKSQILEWTEKKKRKCLKDLKMKTFEVVKIRIWTDEWVRQTSSTDSHHKWL